MDTPNGSMPTTRPMVSPIPSSVSSRCGARRQATLTPDDLAPIDQFHVGGKGATLALAALAGIGPTTRVLDVGGGFGGPARTLAVAYGCAVTVLDLTEEYCQVGEMLTARSGLSDRVAFRHGDALALAIPRCVVRPRLDAAFVHEHRGQTAALHGNLPDTTPRWAARALRDHGRVRCAPPVSGPVGAGRLDQFPLDPRGDARAAGRTRLSRGGLGGRHGGMLLRHRAHIPRRRSRRRGCISCSARTSSNGSGTWGGISQSIGPH